MNNKSLKLLGLLAGFAMCGGLTAQAQDKATLDLLVKRGVISQSDADDVSKAAATPVMVTAKDSAVKGLKLEGLIQTQFDWLTTSDKAAGAANPPSMNQFFVRRAIIGAMADMGNGWSGEILFDFAAGAQAPSGYQSNGSNAAQNSLEKVIVTKKLDDLYAAVTGGFQKVNFDMEEVTSASAVKPIERAPVTRYFDESYKGQTNRRLGFANRHNGLYWDGKVPVVPGLTYGVAVTTGIQNSSGYSPSSGGTASTSYEGGLNRYAFWAYGAYAGKMGDFGYKGGINYGYSQDGNSIAAQANSVMGYNPWVSLTYGKSIQLDAEFLQARVSNGAINGGVTQAASPYGFIITPSYKINDQWEIVGRYSILNTNGRGTDIADVVRDGPDITNTTGASTTAILFDDVQSFYIGLNWYISGNAVKVQVGYEYDQFNNRGSATGAVSASNLTGPRAEVDGVRARLQIAF